VSLYSIGAMEAVMLISMVVVKGCGNGWAGRDNNSPPSV
jgi:hypothetical protein